jgi:tetratricopeptide (TPR) repeat protein
MPQRSLDHAIALQKSGNLHAAIEEFRFLAAASSDANLRSGLMINEVRCYADLGRLQDAENILRQIRQCPPDDREVLFLVDFVAACVTAQGGHNEQALREFEAILLSYPDVVESAEYRDLYEEIIYRRALSLLYLRRNDEALPLLQEATAFAHLSVVFQQKVHLYAGILYTDLQRDKLAKNEFLRAIELNLENSEEADARYRLAALHFVHGGFALAKHELEWILRHEGLCAPSVRRDYVYFLLSRVCEQLGERDDAKRYEDLGKAIQHAGLCS